MKSIKDDRGQLSVDKIITYSIAIILLAIMGIGVALPTMLNQVSAANDGSAATGSYTYSGAPADGKYLNITQSVDGTTTDECYEYDGAQDGAATSGCTAIVYNASTASAAEVADNVTKTVDNTNSTLVIASNDGATVTLTAQQVGVDGNEIETDETSTKASSVELSGGQEPAGGATGAILGLVGVFIALGAIIIVWRES